MIVDVIRFEGLLKFQLSTFLALVALVCLALGWFVDRSRFPAPAELEEQLHESVQLGVSMGSTIQSNRIYDQLDTLDQTEFLKTRRKKLIRNVLDLALYDADAIHLPSTSNKRDSNSELVSRDGMLSMASHSLVLLRVNSVSEFQAQLNDAGFSPEWVADFVLPDGSLDPEISEFVRHALEDNENRND